MFFLMVVELDSDNTCQYEPMYVFSIECGFPPKNPQWAKVPLIIESSKSPKVYAILFFLDAGDVAIRSVSTPKPFPSENMSTSMKFA